MNIFDHLVAVKIEFEGPRASAARMLNPLYNDSMAHSIATLEVARRDADTTNIWRVEAAPREASTLAEVEKTVAVLSGMLRNAEVEFPFGGEAHSLSNEQFLNRIVKQVRRTVSDIKQDALIGNMRRATKGLQTAAL
jgi:hypothetical protein